MSSIWTPGGEYTPRNEPERPPGSGVGPGPGDPGGPGGPGDPGEPGPISAEELDALRRLNAQLRATPAIDVIANHVVQMFQLALVYLGAGGVPEADDATGPTADLVQAGLVIDTMVAIVDGLGPRLAEHEQTLRDALSQIQLVWVQIAEEASPSA